MKVFRYIIKEEEPVITPIADTHIGDERFNPRALQAYLESSDYIILNGDIMNIATRSSVSFEYGSSPKYDLDYAVKIFEPYKNKILAVTKGNHEERISKDVGLDIMELFCKLLGIPEKYAGDGAYIFLNVGSKQINYKIYATHGSGGGKTVGSKANKPNGLSRIVVDADVFVHSHTHQAISYPEDILRANLRKHDLEQATQWFVNTGAFLDYGGYAERFNYKASTIVTPTIKFYGNVREIEITQRK